MLQSLFVVSLGQIIVDVCMSVSVLITLILSQENVIIAGGMCMV